MSTINLKAFSFTNTFQQRIAQVSNHCRTTSTEDPKDIPTTGNNLGITIKTTELSSTVFNSTASSACCCPLNFSSNVDNPVEVQHRVQKLKHNLLIEKDILSSTRRTLVSADDDRMSSAMIGAMATVVLSLCCVWICVPDIIVLAKYLIRQK